MTTIATEHIQLDRAYYHSKVIQANLHHLGAVLSAADADLRDDLASATVRFGQYVSRLNHACIVAARDAEATNALPDVPVRPEAGQT